LQALMTRTAISPRLAIRIFLNRTDGKQSLPVLDRLPVHHQLAFDNAAGFAFDFVHQLHALDDAEHLAHLNALANPNERRRIVRSRFINGFGGSLSGTVLIIVIITKFTKGAYLVLIAMPILYAIMRGINKHYTRVAEELVSDDTGLMLPSRNHVVVLVSKVHKPTLRALAYARATRPDTLTALTVNVDDHQTRSLLADWERHDLPVPLTVLESPYREITKPIISYIRELRTDRPRDVVGVFIPEYVVGHWWEQLLHNQSALRLKGRLLFTPGVMVTTVPYHLESSGQLAGTEM